MRTIWWLAAILLSVFVVSYVFMHGNYHMPDDGWEAYSLQAAAKSMWNQDYFMLWRPGYLLNIPLVYLGFNHFEMKCVYFVLLLLATYWWVWSLKADHLKTILFPIAWISMLYLTVEPGNLNYYGNPVLFMVLGLSAFLTARRVTHPAIWHVLSGLFFSQVVFGNLALFPGVLISIFALAYCYSFSPALAAGDRGKCVAKQAYLPRGRGKVPVAATLKTCPNLLVLFSFLIFLAITLYLYFIPGHAWALNLKYHVPGQFLQDIALKLVLGLMMLCLLIVGSIPWMFRRELAALGFTRKSLPIAAIAFCAIAIFLWGLQHIYSYMTISIILIAPLTLWVIAQLYLLAWFKEFVDQELYQIVKSLLIVICLIAMNNRIISQGTWLGDYYFPLGMVVFWTLAESRWQFSKKILWYLLILLAFLFMPLWSYSTIDLKALISVNRYPSKLGTNTTYLMYKLQNKFLAEYKSQGCASKPLLAYFDLPMMYFLADRVAPFGQSWVTGAKMVPDSKFLTNQHFKNWFLDHPHWCVVWHYSPRTSMGKIRFLEATALMKHLASKKILLGYMGPKVWLYVR